MKMNNITNSNTIMNLSFELRVQGGDAETIEHITTKFFEEKSEIGHDKALLTAKRRSATALGASHKQYQSIRG